MLGLKKKYFKKFIADSLITLGVAIGLYIFMLLVGGLMAI